MKKIYAVVMVFLLSSGLCAIQTKDVIYNDFAEKDPKKSYEGYLALPDVIQKNNPSVLIFHAWKGLGEHEKETARRLAKLGYVAFAADVYGQGIRPKTNQEAAKLSSFYKENRNILREHAQLALSVLKKTKGVTDEKMVALGYCFGGTTALELARDHAKLAGVVSFHGGLDASEKYPSSLPVYPKLLILHGAEDPYVGEDIVSAFKKEAKALNLDYQLIMYSGAVHSFTDRAAGNDPSTGAAYQELADHRSWNAMKHFIQSIKSSSH